jgi:excisionase family DNA binding protein
MKYLTIEELSLYIKASKPTIYLWVAKGIIPCIRCTNHFLRFDITDIDAFMERHKTTFKERTENDNFTTGQLITET